MVHNKSLSRWHIAFAVIVFALTLAAPGFGQDPTGRPKETKEPPKSKRPVKRPPVKVEPVAPTIILTILTDPPECTIYINGEARGVTDSEGKAQFEKVPIASYLVEVRKDGFKPMGRSFRAGDDSPTLVFKLEASLEAEVEEFNALMTAGKYAGPESPNAYEFLTNLMAKYPDRPEVERMRGVLMPSLTEPIEPAIEQTVFNWRSLVRDNVTLALDRAEKAITLKSDDNRLQAKTAYLRGALALRDWMTSGAQPGTEQGDSDEDGTTNAVIGLSAAQREFETALSFDQFFAPARYQLAVALLNAGDFAGAEASFRTLAQLEPKWPFAYTGLGMAYQGMGKYKEAADAHRKAIEVDMNYSAAYAGLGLARAMSRDKNGVKDGTKDIERAKQLDPTSGLPHLNMGMILAQSKKSKERNQAVEELKQAIEKNKFNLEFQNSIAEGLIADLQKNKRK